MVSALLLALGQITPRIQAQKLAETFVFDNKIAGVSIAVVKDGEPALAIGAGFADVAKKAGMEPSTLVRLGSISKPVTAMAVLSLVEEGKLSLDAPIAASVPEWPKDKPTITLRQILTHTSGIRHYRLGKDPTATSFKTYSTGDAVKLFASDPLLFAPGSSQTYSTHAFTVAARAVETASGGSIVDYLRRRVFKANPSELDCEVATDQKPARSNLYALVQGKLAHLPIREDNSWKYGGGGMEATARGLAAWGDKVRRGLVVGERSMALAWTKAELKTENKLDYGMGWRVDGDVVGHSGAQQGCRSSMSIDRTKKLTVVVLTNTSGEHDPSSLAKSVAALYR